MDELQGHRATFMHGDDVRSLLLAALVITSSEYNNTNNTREGSEQKRSNEAATKGTKDRVIAFQRGMDSKRKRRLSDEGES